MKPIQGHFLNINFFVILRYNWRSFEFRKQKYIQEEKEKAMYEEDMFTR